MFGLPPYKKEKEEKKTNESGLLNVDPDTLSN